MARENRAKREERRFGKAERLADLIVQTPASQWRIACKNRDAAIPCIDRLKADVATSVAVVADNVCRYYFEQPKVDWVYKDDFACVSPPFSTFLIEMARPERVNLNGVIGPPDPSSPRHVGFLFHALDAKGRQFLRPTKSGPSTRFQAVDLPSARWFVRAMPLFELDGLPCYVSFFKYFAVDTVGRIIENPNALLTGLALDQSDLERLDHELSQWFPASLLAICFMNCKNIFLEPHEPDPAINRERKKHGKKPFVRYHTINIEPMKRVLRTEGQIEKVGLARALHIVRGHFATYTPERPLFGRVAGTVWRPAHTRGSLDEGVVVSDYAVHGPDEDSVRV